MNDVVSSELLTKRPAAPREVPRPERYFYPVLTLARLSRKPRRVVLFDVPYVVYRDCSGQAVAHWDRCPHRNVALSGGRCQSDDTIECPYHGWRFRPDGSCAQIPGSLLAPRSTHRVPTFMTASRYGLLWICPHPDGPLRDVENLPEFGQPGYSHLLREVTFPASLPNVVENALDVPHTSILHRGLFRSGARNRVRVVLRRYDDWAEAEYVGEPPPRGIVARLLSMGKKEQLTVQHWDRFLAPNLLQVEYRLGSVHLNVSGFCSPITADQTRLFAVVSVRTPFFGWIQRALLALIEPLAMRVYRQDVRILGQQRDTVAAFGGERFMSTELDVLGHAVTRLLKECAEKEQNSGSSVTANGSGPTPADRRQNQQPREVTETEIDA